MNYTFQTHSKVETHKLGQRIAPYFKAGDVVLLKGDLGAGKTTLVGGVADALKCQEDVISPTFNIMIAKVAEHLYARKVFAPLTLGVDPNWKISD